MIGSGFFDPAEVEITNLLTETNDGLSRGWGDLTACHKVRDK